MNQFRLMGVFRAGDAHCMIGCIVAALVTLAFLAPLLSMAAEEKSMQDLSLEIEAAAKKVRNDHSKVSHLLEKEISKIRAWQSKIPPHSAVAPVDLSALSTPLVKINAQGHIQVYIYVRKWGSAERAALEKLGVTIEIANTDFGIIQARVPHGRIKKIARLDFVSRITPPAYGELQAGSVQTEGDAILGGDDVRALGFDGSGVSIGVISIGVVGLATAQSSGDLPFVTVLQTAIDDAEGTAMLEIVHDIAPGATLGFCGLPTRTSLEFIQCVSLLDTTFNADIIVDDIGFFAEPYFEDGMVAQTVKSAVDAGIFYTSAAGNAADMHYEHDYLFNGSIFGFHDFGTRSGGATDTYANFLIFPGETLVIFLQWSEPFGGACSNYDLVLLDQLLNILDISDFPQDCDDDPLEIVFYTNTFPFAIPASIAIDKIWGNDVVLEMFYTLEPKEYNVEAGSVWGHAAVRGVMAVGAIDYSDPGNDDINTFSSRGPSNIFFPASDVREKPDITAIDGVSVTGAGGFPTNFSGTSASAPHVAAIAALLMSADLSATATGISDAIKNSAVDLGSAGPDFTYGFGRIDALAALYELVGCVGNGADSDSDGVDDNCDNCIDVANAGQQDTDGDGHGNICDADLDQSCFTNFNDLAILKSVFFSPDADADLDSSGFVNFNDLALFKGLFFQQPGPSASGSLCDS